jgi:hypothetical protein
MNPTNELTGMQVLVHPELSDDPAMRQGQVGIITGVDLENDDVFVNFGKGEQALYSMNALLVFKPSEEIYKLLMDEARKASQKDYKALFDVNLLQQFGFMPSVRKAMNDVRNNKVVRDFAMDTLENQLQNQLTQRYNSAVFR